MIVRVVAGFGYVLAVLGIGVSIWQYSVLQALEEQNAKLTEDLKVASSDKADILVRLQDVEDRLSLQIAQVGAQEEFIRSLRSQLDERASLGDLEDMVRSATEITGTLKKLSEIDKELLAKYSKVYFLNEHYTPENLTFINTHWLEYKANQQLRGEVVPKLELMLSAMERQGLNPRVVSAYRSYEYQTELKDQYEVVYGSGANTFSADQGFSEHQLGTAVDIVRAGEEMDGFAATAEYQWLLKHAHEYGFTLSYPENNAYYIFEPWHWRFVGVHLATDLYNSSQHFYDLSQRDINNYLVDIFD